MNALCNYGINGIREEIMTKVRAEVKVRLPLYMPRNRMLVQRSKVKFALKQDMKTHGGTR
jgi:hypothetical protein